MRELPTDPAASPAGLLLDKPPISSRLEPAFPDYSTKRENNMETKIGATVIGGHLTQGVDTRTHDHESETELNHGYISDTELSQKELAEKVKNMVKESVERIVKRRTIKKRKRKANILNHEISEHEECTKAYSRCSVPYLFQVFRSVLQSEHRKNLVKEMKFDHLLELDECNVPRLFAQWIAEKTVPDEDSIKIEDKSIPINAQAFVDILGIPAGELPVETDEEGGKAAFLELFGLSEIPSTRFFGDKIINNEDMTDDALCRCFMTVVLGTFICPNSSPRPSIKYMGALIDVDKIKDRNWAKFAHEWMMCYIRKYLIERAKNTKTTITLGGCIYQLAVRYLDFIDFGTIKLPTTLPRIRVWKGDLIKHFSDMDKTKNGNYGAHTIKDLSETCYARAAVTSPQKATDHKIFKEEIEKIAGQLFPNEVKDEIYNAFQDHMIDAERDIYLKAQNLVLDFLKIILEQGNRKPNSETTEIVETQGSTGQKDDEKENIHSERRINMDEDMINNPNSSTNVRDEDMETTDHERDFTEKKIQFAGTSKTDDVRLERSFSLNHTPSEDHGSASSLSKPIGTIANSILDVESPGTSSNEKKHKALAIPSIACIAKEYADSESMSERYSSREEYLKEASKKYFFQDPSFPSFRLFEDHDDNGKFVEEPELRRPFRDTHSEVVHKQADDSYVYSQPKEIPGPMEKDCVDSDFEFSSIQCGQRQPSNDYTHPRGIERTRIETVDEIIVIDSSQPSQPTEIGDNTPRQPILGRRLFDDDFFDTPIRENQKMKQPMSPEVVFLGEKSNQLKDASPEVKFLGERVPSNMFNQMTHTTDELYNAGLTLGNSSISSGKENMPPKRVIHRSNYLHSPYENNGRTMINQHDIKMYETITTLCDDEDFKYKWIINIDNCRVYLKQLGNSMKPDGWVEAWVINAYLRKMFREKHPRQSNKHYFFHTTAEYFLEKWPNEYTKEGWKRNVIKGFHGADSARKLHLSERLHFPSLYDDHWFVFAVDMKARSFLFLDSYYGESSKLHREVSERMITNFRNTWNECNLKDMHFENFGVVYPNLPKQKTPNDCGIFILKYMQYYCTRNPQACAFSAVDIPAFRVEIAVKSLFNEYNVEYEEKEFIRNFDIKAYKNTHMRI